MSRQQRAELARETDRIVREGRYRTPARVEVDIGPAVGIAVRGTVLYQPNHPLDSGGTPADTSRLEVTDESSLAAARRLTESAADPVACLNFASARKPGGGYLSGAQAQEESLARSSALAACLLAAPEFYRFHNENRDARYSDRVIYSPGVPVFRDDSGGLLTRPYRVAFLTAAAPNVSAITDPDQLAEVPAIVLRRASRVLAIARHHGHRRLILGAWGCGVFGNDPSTVAGVFAALLRDNGPFASAFSHVVFAVLDQDTLGERITAFRKTFGVAV